jgi:hypothetical protein
MAIEPSFIVGIFGVQISVKNQPAMIKDLRGILQCIQAAIGTVS